MLPDVVGNSEGHHFLCCHLPGVSAHNQMNLVGHGIDLLKQTLQVNCAAGARRADNEFHR